MMMLIMIQFFGGRTTSFGVPVLVLHCYTRSHQLCRWQGSDGTHQAGAEGTVERPEASQRDFAAPTRSSRRSRLPDSAAEESAEQALLEKLEEAVLCHVATTRLCPPDVLVLASGDRAQDERAADFTDFDLEGISNTATTSSSSWLGLSACVRLLRRMAWRRLRGKAFGICSALKNSSRRSSRSWRRPLPGLLTWVALVLSWHLPFQSRGPS